MWASSPVASHCAYSLLDRKLALPKLSAKRTSLPLRSDTLSASRSITAYKPQLLWDEVKGQYSASVGSRQAVLLHEIWATPIIEGEDPIAHLARIRSAHAQINTGGENLSDRMLGYAMTVALKESFAIIKQNLWLREPLRSADVAGADRPNGRGAKQTTLRSLCLLSETTTRMTTRPAIAFLVQILQLIAINTRHITPPMIVSGANGWRIRKRMHGWRSIQIRPTVPLQLPTLQATKAITQYLTIHPMPELSMQIRILTLQLRTRYSS